jgi:hypothetical protein
MAPPQVVAAGCEREDNTAAAAAAAAAAIAMGCSSSGASEGRGLKLDRHPRADQSVEGEN